MEKLASKLKESLERFGFRQKGTSPFFFYDCNWYYIFAELIKLEGDIYVITGIQFFLNRYDKFAVIREEKEGDLNYRITKSSTEIMENTCKWIAAKKDYFLNLYKDPAEMLLYLKRYNDLSHQPHGYILARMLRKKDEVKFFEETTKNRFKEVNAKPGNYLLYVNGGKYREIEADIYRLMKMDDKEFTEEMNKRINESRKELDLETHENYFG